jgi:putrescine aminotransferase
LGAGKVAAFIGEPIQGAGGVLIPPETYWPEIARICRERNMLLIADEVITGFGRTGRWFGSQYYAIEPDLVTFAKAVTNGFQPLGGVLVGERVASVVMSRGGEFAHGFTYSGHPAACAAGLATLAIHARERIADRVENELAPYFQKRLRELADHPLVGEVRGVGALGALELVPAKPSRRRFDKVGTVGTICRDLCVRNGLVMRAVGDTMILAPPLVLQRAHVDELIAKARRSLDDTMTAIGSTSVA